MARENLPKTARKRREVRSGKRAISYITFRSPPQLGDMSDLAARTIFPNSRFPARRYFKFPIRRRALQFARIGDILTLLI